MTKLKNTQASIWNDKQEKKIWKLRYEEVQKELAHLTPATDVLGELGNNTQAPPWPKDRRKEPRYKFKQVKELGQVLAYMGLKAFEIHNISTGGIAFYSDVVFLPGQPLLLSALGIVALDVKVIKCIMEETNADFMEYRYLVHAQFSSRVNGYLVYVLSREMYLNRLRGEPAPS